MAAETGHLQSSLSDLAGLVTGTRDLHELLALIAGFAQQAVPGADGAGVTLLRVDRADNQVEALAANAPFVSQLDEIQYTVLDEGPGITAVLELRSVHSGSLGGEQTWPRFGPRVGRLGVHSVLSLPLLLPDQVIGAINVYAYAKDAFDKRAIEFGERFAVPAAVAVHNAHVLEQARVLTAQLQTAMISRAIIDQAIGLIRGRSGGSAADAFGRLRVISQKESTKLATVAERIVDDAVRRAHERQSQAAPTEVRNRHDD